MDTYFLEVIGKTLKEVIGWFGQGLEAAIDWGWVGISEWSVILFVLGFLTWLGIKIFKK